MDYVTPESYGPTPPFDIKSIHLTFDLHDTETKVESVIIVKPRAEAKDLVLNGEELKLLNIEINGKALKKDSEYSEDVKNSLLTIKHSVYQTALKESGGEAGEFTLRIVNEINPTTNTQRSGLYKSDNLLTTQCEAEGFRRITYFLDRPDVMTKFQVTLRGDKKKYPTLLSNGNLIKTSESDGVHTAVFDDPFKKPSYLFAVIAGPLDVLEDEFVYEKDLPSDIEGMVPMKGRVVKLYCYAESAYIQRCRWALECVKKAMAWDYEEWHRGYDLDRFSIVCISDFNAGAMENKSLTTYNISCILGCKSTATDARLQRICSVIGHEYFHNWSGNRVTVESWFNITLKEGFTNFREQEFDRYVWSEGCKRIEAVKSLRSLQFPEDAGPMSHPICPSKYVSIDNFYTMTVYEKGSEVIGMIQHLVGGTKNFRRGTDHYFTKYDGCAVNYHHFAAAVFEACGWSNEDSAQFFRWYHQKGTPKIQIRQKSHDVSTGKLCLTVKQILPSFAAAEGKTEAEPYLLPLVLGVIGKESGEEIVPTTMFQIREFEQEITVEGVKEKNFVLSTNRGFAAPVIMDNDHSEEDLACLLAHDTDSFNRWDAGQELYKKNILQTYENFTDGQVVQLGPTLVEGIKGVLEDKKIDSGFRALALMLPTAAEIEALLEKSEPVKLCRSIKAIRDAIGKHFKTQFETIFKELWADGSKEEPWSCDQAGDRSLRNRCLSYISVINDKTSAEEIKEIVERVENYSKKVTTYNDKSYVFAIESSWPSTVPAREAGINRFYEAVKNDENLLDDWFATISGSSTPDILERVQALRKHERYANNKNNNRFRALAGAFSRNLEALHHESGEGYKILAEEIANFDKINPYTSALVAKQMANFRKYQPNIQKAMRAQLEWLKSQNLSKNTEEIVMIGLKD